MFTELFKQYELGELSTSRFSDALWNALCKIIPYYDHPSFPNIPVAVQNYYSSHDIEYSVGDAGFYEAAINSPERLPPARRGYEALGLPLAAALIAEAERLLALEGKESDAYLDDAWSANDAKLDEAGWWAQEARINYALANRHEFASLDGRFGT